MGTVLSCCVVWKVQGTGPFYEEKHNVVTIKSSSRVKVKFLELSLDQDNNSSLIWLVICLTSKNRYTQPSGHNANFSLCLSWRWKHLVFLNTKRKQIETAFYSLHVLDTSYLVHGFYHDSFLSQWNVMKFARFLLVWSTSLLHLHPLENWFVTHKLI